MGETSEQACKPDTQILSPESATGWFGDSLGQVPCPLWTSSIKSQGEVNALPNVSSQENETLGRG